MGAIHSRERKEEDRVTGKNFCGSDTPGAKTTCRGGENFRKLFDKAPGILAVAKYDYSPVKRFSEPYGLEYARVRPR